MEPLDSAPKVGYKSPKASEDEEFVLPLDQEVEKEILQDKKERLEQRVEHVRQVWDRLDAPAGLARVAAFVPAVGFGLLFCGVLIPGFLTWIAATIASAASDERKEFEEYADAVRLVVFAPLTTALGLLQFTFIGKADFNYEDPFGIKPLPPSTPGKLLEDGSRYFSRARLEKNEKQRKKLYTKSKETLESIQSQDQGIVDQAKAILGKNPQYTIPELSEVRDEMEELKEDIESLEAIERHLQAKIDNLSPAVTFSSILSFVPLVLSGAIAIPYFLAIGLLGVPAGALIGWAEELASETKEGGLIEARVGRVMSVATLPFAVASVLWEFMRSGKMRSLDDVMPLAWQLGDVQEKRQAAKGPPTAEMEAIRTERKTVRVVNHFFDQGRYWESLAELEDNPEYYQKAIQFYKAANHEFITEVHQKFSSKDHQLKSTITQLRVSSLVDLSEEKYHAFMQTLGDHLKFVRAKLLAQRGKSGPEKEALDRFFSANRSAITAYLNNDEGSQDQLEALLKFVQVKNRVQAGQKDAQKKVLGRLLSINENQIVQFLRKEIEEEDFAQTVEDSIQHETKQKDEAKQEVDGIIKQEDWDNIDRTNFIEIANQIKEDPSSRDVEVFLKRIQGALGVEQLPSALFAIARCHQKLGDAGAARAYVDALKGLNQKNAERLIRRADVELFPAEEPSEEEEESSSSGKGGSGTESSSSSGV